MSNKKSKKLSPCELKNHTLRAHFSIFRESETKNPSIFQPDIHYCTFNIRMTNKTQNIKKLTINYNFQLRLMYGRVQKFAKIPQI